MEKVGIGSKLYTGLARRLRRHADGRHGHHGGRARPAQPDLARRRPCCWAARPCGTRRSACCRRRQADAKQAVRKHIDEVTFQVGKDSRDMLRRTQRQLRDHFSALAEEVSTSISASVAGRAERGEDHRRGPGAADPRPQGRAGPDRRAGRAGPQAGRPREAGGRGRTRCASIAAPAATSRSVRRCGCCCGAPSTPTPTARRPLGWLRHNLARFDEPLRVAIAGKVKAGKSTLLNALVGESIAPTDAGECTRIVTWYVDAQLAEGDHVPAGRGAEAADHLAVERRALVRPAGHPGGAGRPARGAVARRRACATRP